jgi:hypothetical protein
VYGGGVGVVVVGVVGVVVTGGLGSAAGGAGVLAG